MSQAGGFAGRFTLLEVSQMTIPLTTAPDAKRHDQRLDAEPVRHVPAEGAHGESHDQDDERSRARWASGIWPAARKGRDWRPR